MKSSKAVNTLIKKFPDETNEIYNQGFSEGEKHSNPSQDTIKYLKDMDEKIDKLKDEMNTCIKRIEVTVAELPQRIYEKIDNAYARKKDLDEVVMQVDDIKISLSEKETKKEDRVYGLVMLPVVVTISSIIGGIVTVVMSHLFNIK